MQSRVRHSISNKFQGKNILMSGTRNWTPRIITGLQGVAVNSSQIDLSWLNNEKGSYDGLKIYISIDNVSFTLKDTIAIGTTYSATGLTANFYYFKIALYKGSKISAFSNTVRNEFPLVLLHQTGGVNDFIIYDTYDGTTLTKDGSNKVSKLADKLLSANDIAQANGNMQPLLTDDGILFDGVASVGYGDALSKAFTLPQPTFVFSVIKQVTWQNAVAIFDGGIASTCIGFQYNATPGIMAYAGNLSTMDSHLPLGQKGIIRMLFNGASSKFIIDNNTPITGDFGSANMGGFSWGGKITGSSCANIVGYCTIISRVLLSTQNETDIYNYLVEKYINTLTEKFDGVLENSILIEDKTTWKIRNEIDKYSFNYDGNIIRIKVKPTLYGVTGYPSFPNLLGIAVFVNDQYYKLVSFTDENYETVFLPVGAGKKITLVEGAEEMSALGICGTFITFLLADSSYSKINEVVSSERLVFIDDSILSFPCKNATPQIHSIPALFRIENNKDVANYGWSKGKLSEFASSAGLINTTVANIVSLFSTSTNKKLIIALGTNDYGIDSMTAATFETQYTGLIDAIHAADATIKIWCISPILRSDAKEDATLDDYRTRVGTICTARSTYCNHIAGKSILTYPDDYYDTLHPSIAGSKKYKDAIHLAIYGS